MGVVRSSHFWQLGSIASLATETTGGEILVAFWPKHCLRSDLRVPLKCTQWPYQSKIASSGPESTPIDLAGSNDDRAEQVL